MKKRDDWTRTFSLTPVLKCKRLQSVDIKKGNKVRIWFSSIKYEDHEIADRCAFCIEGSSFYIGGLMGAAESIHVNNSGVELIQEEANLASIVMY